MFQVGITDFLTDATPLQLSELDGLARIECLMARDESELIGRVEKLAGLIVFHDIQLTATIMDRLERCQVIVRGGVGYDNVDAEAAGPRGIFVCNIPDYGVDEVADHAIGLLLAVTRKIGYADRSLRADPTMWSHFLVEPVPRLAVSTLGIVGLGRIGTATALRARALKLRVVAYDPHIPDGRARSVGVDAVSFDELLAESDMISLHTPLTDETRHMMDAAALAKMKPGAVLVNTSRGAVVDLAALAEALKSGHLSGAGIDVFPVEPPEPDHPLVRYWRDGAAGSAPNLIITPHTAFYSAAGLGEICEKTVAEVARVLRGEAPRNPVNLACYVPRNGQK